MFGQDDGYPAPPPISDEDMELMEVRILAMAMEMVRKHDEILEDSFLRDRHKKVETA